MTNRTIIGRAAAAALPFLLLGATSVQAQIIPGGGSKKADCYAVFAGLTQSGKTNGKPRVDCSDQDPTCDQDTTLGQCTFKVGMCASQAAIGACSPPPPEQLTFPKNTGLLPTSPLVSGTIGTCAPDGQVVVPLKGKKKNKTATKKIVLVAQAPAGIKPPKDNNTLYLRCKPCTGANCGIVGPTGNTCPNRADGGPRQLTYLVATDGNDLDNGVTGNSHNFRVPSNTNLNFCLSGCDNTTNPICSGEGSTGKNSVNGGTFGPPLPLLASGVPVCVVNQYRESSLKSTYNLQTGEFSMAANPILLDSKVYLTNPTSLCPKCSATSIKGKGTCDSGANSGGSCTTEGIVLVNSPPTVRNVTYYLSSDCPPSSSDFQATLDIRLGLTTGTSTLAGNAAGNFPCPGQTRHDDCINGAVCSVDCSARPDTKGGINQYCCSTGNTPCFPTSPAAAAANPALGQIVRTGSTNIVQPVWPDPAYPKTSAAGTTGVLAATFCEAKTGSNTIDTSTGLPGPGSLLLNGTSTVYPNQ